jgi:peptidoglycan lytic transglycosylase A
MEQNPDGANELRRQNRSYVFFREVQLSDKDEPLGAQGVPLTPGRSIAVDKALHVYGTPFFIAGELPIESELSKTSFRRLMIAQDTGSAIVGPARADLYFGAGADAGKVSGRLRHNMHFLILVPKSIDPAARARRMPLPDPRPSGAIAKLLDQEKAEKEKPEKEKLTPADAMTTGPADAANTAKAANDATSKPVEAAAPVAQPSATPTTTAPVPIPEPRPNIATGAEARRSRHHHPYRLSR